MAIAKTERYYAKDRKTWRKWLEKNHDTSAGIWLVSYKKDSGKSRVPYADAVEEALCYGWIDSTLNPIDDDSFMQLFTPRKAKSGWSKVNKERIERLIANGLMTPAGMEKIDAAKANGSWSKLDDVEAFVIPDELQKAFKADKVAGKFFESCSASLRKMMLYHINSAKREETKAKRVEEIVGALSKGKLPDRYAPVPKAKK